MLVQPTSEPLQLKTEGPYLDTEVNEISEEGVRETVGKWADYRPVPLSIKDGMDLKGCRKGGWGWVANECR